MNASNRRFLLFFRDDYYSSLSKEIRLLFRVPLLFLGDIYIHGRRTLMIIELIILIREKKNYRGGKNGNETCINKSTNRISRGDRK